MMKRCQKPSAFLQTCLSSELSDEAKKTLSSVLLNVGEESCDEAEVKLQETDVLFLESLDLVDLSPIQDLPHLKTLYLRNNKIVDLEPLANLKNLSFLDLPINQVEDLSSLSPLKSLAELNVLGNPIGTRIEV